MGDPVNPVDNSVTDKLNNCVVITMFHPTDDPCVEGS